MLHLLPIIALLAACASPVVEEACNGHAELCDRPLDQVTLAGTHNSMSNAEAGWLPPYQQYGLSRQLEDGVRALMLDTYEWEGEAVLCHNDCDLGSQSLAEGLGEIASFLAANPNEVVLIIFQDSLSVEGTVAVLEEVGLDDTVWTWDGATVPLPTLRELIDAGHRLIVSAEFSGPPPDWYHSAWDLIFDTPYDFASAEEFSCALSRGDEANPLFLVNHWVSLPWPSEEASASVNTEGVLGERAASCAELGGRPVDILAVDFYAVGDLFTVVDDLNSL